MPFHQSYPSWQCPSTSLTLLDNALPSGLAGGCPVPLPSVGNDVRVTDEVCVPGTAAALCLWQQPWAWQSQQTSDLSTRHEVNFTCRRVSIFWPIRVCSLNGWNDHDSRKFDCTIIMIIIINAFLMRRIPVWGSKCYTWNVTTMLNRIKKNALPVSLSRCVTLLCICTPHTHTYTHTHTHIHTPHTHTHMYTHMHRTVMQQEDNNSNNNELIDRCERLKVLYNWIKEKCTTGKCTQITASERKHVIIMN